MKKQGETKTKKRVPTPVKVIGIILLILILLAGSLYGFYHSKISRLTYDDGTVSDYAEDASDLNSGADDIGNVAEGLEDKDVIAADDEIASSKDVVNILLIGTDERSKDFTSKARGDTCMLLSINKKSGAIKLVSFERATAVPILSGPYKGQYDWLTHTFRYGGADLMLREIKECYRIDVTRYIRVNISTFIEGINAIGGVDINLTQAEADYINYPKKSYAILHIKEMKIQDKVQKVNAGLNHLNGETAMLYARCRAIDSDWGRVKRQQKVIQAAMNQVKNLSVTELNTTLNNVLPLVQTNLKESEITSLLLAAPKYQGAKAESMTLPQKGTYGHMKGMGGRSMFATDFKTNAKILKEFIY